MQNILEIYKNDNAQHANTFAAFLKNNYRVLYSDENNYLLFDSKTKEHIAYFTDAEIAEKIFKKHFPDEIFYCLTIQDKGSLSIVNKLFKIKEYDTFLQGVIRSSRRVEKKLKIKYATMENKDEIYEKSYEFDEELLIKLINNYRLAIARNDKEELVGYIAINDNDAIDYLYVFPEFRRKGYGTELLCHMISVCLKNDKLAYFQVPENCLGVINLLKKLGIRLPKKVYKFYKFYEELT